MERYRSYSDEMREIFGRKVYKLSLDAGMTCPNRDGTLGTGGCTFCLGGAGEFAAGGRDLSAQIEAAKARVAFKARDAGYVAYFQSYTNTYAPVSRLREIFDPAAAREEILGLAVGTRPDCLEPEKVAYLAELNRLKPVWVELGLQTIHEKTARAIRRGYPLAVFDDAVARLRAAGLRVVVHVILNLPGETPEEMLETVDHAAGCGACGIKLHQLHVLRGTELERQYLRGEVRLFTLDEYVAVLEDAVRRLPPEMTIHRLTGDGPKRFLIAPMWTADKKRVLQAIREAFCRDDVHQGSDFCRKGPAGEA